MSRFDDLNVIQRQNVYNTRLYNLGKKGARVNEQLPPGDAPMNVENFISLIKRSIASIQTFSNSFIYNRPRAFENVNAPPALTVSTLASFGQLPGIYDKMVISLQELERWTSKFNNLTSNDLTPNERKKIVDEYKRYMEVFDELTRKFINPATLTVYNVENPFRLNPLMIDGAQDLRVVTLMIESFFMNDGGKVYDNMKQFIKESKSVAMSGGGGFSVPGYHSKDNTIPRKFL